MPRFIFTAISFPTISLMASDTDMFSIFADTTLPIFRCFCCRYFADILRYESDGERDRGCRRIKQQRQARHVIRVRRHNSSGQCVVVMSSRIYHVIKYDDAACRHFASFFRRFRRYAPLWPPLLLAPHITLRFRYFFFAIMMLYV